MPRAHRRDRERLGLGGAAAVALHVVHHPAADRLAVPLRRCDAPGLRVRDHGRHRDRGGRRRSSSRRRCSSSLMERDPEWARRRDQEPELAAAQSVGGALIADRPRRIRRRRRWPPRPKSWRRWPPTWRPPPRLRLPAPQRHRRRRPRRHSASAVGNDAPRGRMAERADDRGVFEKLTLAGIGALAVAAGRADDVADDVARRLGVEREEVRAALARRALGLAARDEARRRADGRRGRADRRGARRGDARCRRRSRAQGRAARAPSEAARALVLARAAGRRRTIGGWPLQR